MRRVKFVKQKDSMYCGVASLSMVCSIMGEDYPVSTLERFCHPSAMGVSLRAIAVTAEAVGLNATPVRMGLANLKSLDGNPCILHWNQNHFVVCYRYRRGKYYIADPGKGLYKCSEAELIEHWLGPQYQGDGKGIAMTFEATPDFGKLQKVDEEGRRSLRFLWKYVVRYRRYFLHIAVGLLLGSLMQLVLPFLTQAIVDIGIKQENVKFIWLILLGEFMIVAGRTGGEFVRRRILIHISMRINISLVSDFLIKLLRLPVSFFDTKLMGDLLRRMSDHGRVQSFLTEQLLVIVFSMLTFIVLGSVLCIYNVWIFLIFICCSIVYALWIASFLKKRKVIDYELFENQAAEQNKTYQFITSIKEIKLQDCEQRRRWEWEDVQADLFAVQMKSIKLVQTQQAGSIFINEMKNILITVLAATAVINGQMTLGAMLAIQYIIGQLNSPVERLMEFIYSAQDVKLSLERINEVHLTPDEQHGRETSTEFVSDTGIVLRNVTFRYEKLSPQPTIDGASMVIAPGKVTAIVGASGSGKTTLVNLMLGFYDVDSGAIEVMGRDVNSYNMKWWRRNCGVVMQDGVIFSESITRNIAVDDNDVDMAKVMEAARIANLHDTVMDMPMKYDTIVGHDGIGLSQGQKQRILIARAVYKNPRFIFLDEATNALDARNERIIVENLDRFFNGRTVVVVAHRLSTVKNADSIVVLDHGKVVETGNHETLTAAKGHYYQLVKNQLELGA